MGILDALKGGGPFKQDQKKNTYNVYMKFDDDQEHIVFEGVKNANTIVLEIKNTGDKYSYIEFIDPKSGKKFKLYCK